MRLYWSLRAGGGSMVTWASPNFGYEEHRRRCAIALERLLSGRARPPTSSTKRKKTAAGSPKCLNFLGVLAYGATADEAMAKAEVLALRVLAERLEHKEAKPQAISIGIAAA
jgi:hypothetical protein